MKKVIFLICSFYSFIGLGQSTSEIVVMSYNIRMNSPDDGVNIWDNRKEWLAESIVFFEGDVVGAQEVTYKQLLDLQSLLPEYGHLGMGRQGGNEGEFSPIFYRKEKYDVLEHDTFWLSENPEEIASKGWDAALPRIVTWAKFRDKKADKTFYVFNTHLDHKGEEARKESAKLILQRMQEITGDAAVILTGDFNITPESEPYDVLINNLKDAFLETDLKYTPGYTFNGWNMEAEGNFHRIDYVFYKGKTLNPDKYHVLDGQRGARFISDHFPVIVKFDMSR